MTNLEAIKGKIVYPLSDNSCILALNDRELIETDTYVKGKAFDLAYADLIITLLHSPNVSEGGYSISISDKAALEKVATGIYAKYGVKSSLTPTATFVQKW
jgi:hypothetical protein